VYSRRRYGVDEMRKGEYFIVHLGGGGVLFVESASELIHIITYSVAFHFIWV
jgi:hypothetical protein